MPTVPESSLISLVSELGFGVSAICFSGYLIIFLLKSFASERQIWIDKDGEADLRVSNLLSENSKLQMATTEKLADLQANQSTQILNVVDKLNVTLGQMNISITELKQSIETAESIKLKRL